MTHFRSIKELVLIRHGEASSYAPTDYARSLTQNGHREACATGQLLNTYLQGHQLPIQLLYSSALRTRETWTNIVTQLTPDVSQRIQVQETPTLYLATHDQLENHLLEVDALANEEISVILLGHNPGLSQLTAYAQSPVHLSTGQLVRVNFTE